MLSSGLRRGALALLLLSVSSLCQAGLAPRLVRDIDEVSYAGSSSPRQFGGAYDGDDGGDDGPCYVWDGAGAAVRQIEDDLSCPAPFIVTGDRLYFGGFQPQTGAELWVMEE